MSARTPSPKALLKIPEFEQKVQDRLDDLLKAMIDLALGHFVTVAKFNKNTGEVETRIYEQPPDYKALSFLIENVIGKVPSRLEITGAGGGPVKVVPYMTMEEAIRVGIVQRAMQEQKQLEAGGSDSDEDDSATVDGEYTVTDEDEDTDLTTEGGDADAT